MRKRLASGPPYFVLLGVVIGLLVAGVVVPLTFGNRDAQLAGAGAGSGSGRGPGSDVLGESGLGAAAGSGAGGALGAAGGQAGATGGTGATGASGAGGGAAGAAGGLTASDVGVTAETIRLGIMILDVGSLGTFGIAVPGADPTQQREAWGAWIGELNDRGGVFGRQIEPFYRTYDVLDGDDQLAACREATEDAQVFAAIDAGGMNPSAALCFTQEHGVPFLTLGSQGFPTRTYQRAGGLLFSLFAEGQRTMANFVWELHQLGMLPGATIGILDEDAPGATETVDQGTVATLEALGYEVAHRATLSDDINTAAGQIPVAVQQMSTAGVDLVLLLTANLAATQFVQEADSRGYHPRYAVSDWGGGYSDTYVSNMPDSFDGTLITTNRTGERRLGMPEPAFDAECREIYEQRTGKKLNEDNAEYAFSIRGCTLMRLFELGGKVVGPDLTRTRLSGAIQSLGEVPLATFGGGGFAPGKFGAADLVRTAVFDPPCEGGNGRNPCWTPVDDFRAPHF